MTLEKHRSRLSQITQEILRLHNEREKTVMRIQKVKKEKNQTPWDPKQERVIFPKLIDSLGELSLKKVFWLSLLIEMHCDDCGDYPSWSNRVHVLGSENESSLIYQVNPVLLSLTYPEAYANLRLTEDYKLKIAEAFERDE